jgi:oligopeptide transport system ATP-binding protein
MAKKKVLEVNDLRVSFKTNTGYVKAVRDISFDLFEGETLAIVGESGSGKSVTSRTIMGILTGNATIESGSIMYENQDLVKTDEESFHKIRGHKIGMIFQDPMSSLNPIMTIGKQITEALIINGNRLKNQYNDLIRSEKMNVKHLREDIKKLHKNKKQSALEPLEYKKTLLDLKTNLSRSKIEFKEKKVFAKDKIKNLWLSKKNDIKKEVNQVRLNASFSNNEKSEKIANLKDELLRFRKVTKKEANERALKVMREVSISEPEKRFKQYPFQFSGGMRQRIVIAIALSANPDILICDEPTTALDVTIQAQILDLINELKQKRNLSVIFITHDLGVVANMADRVAVMYAGKIVEIGSVQEMFYNPQHPYTWALLGSMPDVNSNARLHAIPGTPPDMHFPPIGDAFAPRNEYALEIDFEEDPPMFKLSESHYVKTWLLHEYSPKINPPQIIVERHENYRKKIERAL